MAFQLVGSLGGRALTYPLQAGTHRVGSAAGCDLRLSDPTISRAHAELQVAGERVELADLGSRNGTFVDGRRVARETLPVRAEIAFGRVKLRLEPVDGGDLEMGLPLAPSPAGAAGANRPAERRAALSPVTTIGTRALDAFACEHLPRLLRVLGEGADATRMAQAGGSALFETLPLLALQVMAAAPGSQRLPGERGEASGGVLFAARREEVPGMPVAGFEEVCRQGEFAVRAVFPSESAARVFRPLAESVAALVGLAASRHRPAPAAPRPAAPALPEPPSVVRAVQDIFAAAARVAAGDVGVLIRGESGTGKEVLARYIHAASPRAGERFVALNCAALPRDLLEAELFGIERGVATGVEPRPGKFEQADGGTLFLDEIGDMALETQVRILRALQAGEVYRIGGGTPRQARVRVLAATHQDIARMRAEGSFREDLYYRIAAWEVELPPLRRRRADIPNLAAHFLARCASRRGLALRGISHAALELLVGCGWPGNIRQLENEMARAVLFLGDGELLDTRRLSPEVQLGARRDGPGGDGGSLAEVLARVERGEIAKALAAHGGDVGAAAVALGLGRSTLYRRMRVLGVHQPQ
jgi:DNA-binding NtrC family response regulator